LTGGYGQMLRLRMISFSLRLKYNFYALSSSIRLFTVLKQINLANI
jgi:hypothetical protein